MNENVSLFWMVPTFIVGALVVLVLVVALPWFVYRRTQRLGLSLVTCGALVVMLPLLSLVYPLMLLNYAGERAFEARWQAWQDRGGPTEAADIRPARPEDPEQNAATWYLRAVEVLAASEEARSIERETTWEDDWTELEREMGLHLFDPLSEPFGHPIDGLVEAFELIEPEAELYELLDRASELEEVRWRSGTDPRPLGSWHVGQTRQLSRFLVADARLALERGDAEQADQALKQLLILGDHSAAEPNFTNSYVVFSYDMMALRAVLLLYQGRDDVPQQTIETAASRRHRDRIKRAMMGEMLNNLDYIELSRQIGVYDGLSLLPGIIDYDRAFLVQYRINVIDEMVLPRYEQDRSLFLDEQDIPIWANASRELAPYNENLVKYAAQGDSRIVLAATAAAVRTHRQEHGEHPQSLREVFDEVPTDAWDGNEIEYERRGDGFILYVQGQEDQEWGVWDWSR